MATENASPYEPALGPRAELAEEDRPDDRDAQRVADLLRGDEHPGRRAGVRRRHGAQDEVDQRRNRESHAAAPPKNGRRTVKGDGNGSTALARGDGIPRRAELADFLRTRREAIRPEEVGLPTGGRRRTPGLRREEVAQLAGVSTTWYTRPPATWATLTSRT